MSDFDDVTPEEKTMLKKMLERYRASNPVKKEKPVKKPKKDDNV